MESAQIVGEWFQRWETGDYRSIPVADDFTHTSPFGTIEGKADYLALVAANEPSFLGFQFEIQDALYGEDRACVRYTARKGDFELEAAEWFFLREDEIEKIISYYNVGDVSYGDMNSADLESGDMEA